MRLRVFTSILMINCLASTSASAARRWVSKSRPGLAHITSSLAWSPWRRQAVPPRNRTVSLAMHRGSAPEMPAGAWKTEPWDKGLRFSVQYSSVLHDVRSRFQHIQVLQTPALGKMLVLDDAIQTSERDESGYHEMIAHVPLCRRGRRVGGDLRVLIIGGGDGGVAREVLRHKDVTRVDLVDIDEEVMNVARTHLPSIWRNPNSPADAPQPLETDERFRAHPKDGVKFLQEQKEGYDVIVVDASDPVGPGAVLYSNEFYSLLRDRLRPNGAVSVQSGSFWYMPEILSTVYHGLKQVFPCVRTYQCFTAVYPGGLWNLQCATLGDDPADVDEAKADELASRYGLSWYNAAAHRATFTLPPIADRVLRRPPPLLSDVTHNLEEVMATEGATSEVPTQHTWSDATAAAIDRLIAAHKSTNDEPKLAVFDADGTIWRDDVTHAFWMYVLQEKLADGEAERDLYLLKSVLEQWDGTVDPPTSMAGVSQLETRLMPGCRMVSTHFYSYMRRLGQQQSKVLDNFFQSLDPIQYRRDSIYWAMRKLKDHGWKIAVVSASPRTLVEGALRRVQLTSMVDVVVGGEDSDQGAYPAFSGKVALLRDQFQQPPMLAVGDSLGDFALFDACKGLSIVLLNRFNPALESLSRQAGWTVEDASRWE